MNTTAQKEQQTAFTCVDCQKVFKNSQAIRCHIYRESTKSATEKCGYKRRLKDLALKRNAAQRPIAGMDPIEIVDKVNASSKTNELLQQLTYQMDKMKEQID